MFRFLELELHGWDYWQPLRIPLDAGVVVLSGPNGSGKTTMLDAIRQILHAGRLSQNRRISHYLRLPNEPALLRAVVSNRADQRGRRPFERQQVLTDEATLACALVPNGGSSEKRFAVLPGKVAPQELQKYLLEGREWLQPDQYRRVLENAGVSRSLMHILALEQGRADELSHQKPRELFKWIMEARGAQQVLERYTSARRQYEDSVREVSRQNEQVLRYQAILGELERKIRRLDEHIAKKGSVKDAEDIKRAAPLQVMITELSDIEKRLPDVRTRSTALATTVDRLQRDLEAQRKVVDSLRAQSNTQTEIERVAEKEWDDAVGINARLSVEVERKQEAAAELATIPEEDKTELEKGLACARSENFRAEQLRLDRISDLEQCERLITDLERGIRRYPIEVKSTLEALTNVGVNAVLMAERVEISDTSWTTAVESALGNLRYAICVRQDEEKLASEIARAHGFLGPIVSTLSTITESTAAGPLKFTDAVPEWIIDWGRHIILTDSAEIAAGASGLTQDGTRRDDYGIWVGQAADRVLGGSAIRHQLEQARQRHGVIALGLAAAQKAAALSAQSVEEIEGRLTRQNRRNELLREVAFLPELQRNLAIATATRDSKKEERDRARESLAQAERVVLESERWLDRKQDELEKRTDELERNRTAVADMETRKAFLESDIDVLKSQLSHQLIDEAEAGKLGGTA